jgi:hypothetical protein
MLLASLQKEALTGCKMKCVYSSLGIASRLKTAAGSSMRSVRSLAHPDDYIWPLHGAPSYMVYGEVCEL